MESQDPGKHSWENLLSCCACAFTIVLDFLLVTLQSIIKQRCQPSNWHLWNRGCTMIPRDACAEGVRAFGGNRDAGSTPRRRHAPVSLAYLLFLRWACSGVAYSPDGQRPRCFVSLH
jgi:hypothetical protein